MLGHRLPDIVDAGGIDVAAPGDVLDDGLGPRVHVFVFDKLRHRTLLIFPPLRGAREGEVSPSYGDGGVMGHRIVVASGRCAATSPSRAPRWGGCLRRTTS